MVPMLHPPCYFTANFLHLQADTARVVWSWNSRDPPSPSQINQHEHQGTTSLNLLGGLNEERQDPSGASSFVIRNENVRLQLLFLTLSSSAEGSNQLLPTSIL